ncbi:hypothetical protein MUK42_34399 [Musa troglodytarum]|uniref:Uncharacterized protein n=1 Tax=Musa troglodytarum TaxID=320322 RepID=A0A9E7LDT0_9LILI|nr:hypothetical protein MUK42_34399 [Musa troglodytarum]
MKQGDLPPQDMSSLVSELFDRRSPVVGSLKKKGALQMQQTADKEEKNAGMGKDRTNGILKKPADDNVNPLTQEVP